MINGSVKGALPGSVALTGGRLHELHLCRLGASIFEVPPGHQDKQA